MKIRNNNVDEYECSDRRELCVHGTVRSTVLGYHPNTPSLLTKHPTTADKPPQPTEPKGPTVQTDDCISKKPTVVMSQGRRTSCAIALNNSKRFTGAESLLF